MNIRCQYCRNSFNLSRDFLQDAVSKAAESKQKYVIVDCVNCRKTVKVPVKQMQRYLPRTEE